MDNDDLDDNISSNIELKKYINQISKLFNIKLYPNDLENIINIYQLIDINKLLNFRYSDDNIINNDPFISKLKEKYPIIKKTKDKDTKKLNDKNKQKIKKSLVSFKKYLLDVTKLLLTIILIFIHMQISTNTYPINLNNMYNIFIFDDKSTWKMFNISNDDSFLNKRLIEYINVKIETKIKSLYEKLENKSLFDQPDLKSHMTNTIKYILNPQYNLYKAIDRYYTLTITSGYLYTKEYWTTFKPLYDNKLVLKINHYVNSHNEIMKQYFMNNDSLENISLIKDINNVQSKYEEFRLPVSNLMNNPSYKRLYMYSLKLYGKCNTVPPILDLLTNKFINDMNNQDITDLLKSCNYMADHTVFVGSWLKRLDLWERRDSSVILNGSDKSIFNAIGKKKKPLPFKLVTHHWSNNFMKGFDIYKYLDDLLVKKYWKKKIQFTYIGRLPKNFEFKNTKVLKPLHKKKLSKTISRHHIYVTGSINEPGGNHQNEGALCGLPLLYRKSGCFPEYCSGYGEEFTPKTFENALKKIIKKFSYYKKKIKSYPHTSDKTIESYEKLFKKLILEKDKVLKKRLKKNDKLKNLGLLFRP